MEQPQTWDNIRRIMERHTAFAQWLSNQELVENVRQQGVILAFDLRTSETVSYFNSLRDRIWQFFIERGLLLRPLGNTVYVLPPYCITDEQLERVYQGVRDLLLDLA
jgi:adenosylmethionine-8-amino-7-oxononanoate aminotransferase